jgi:hypothetical protein
LLSPFAPKARDRKIKNRSPRASLLAHWGERFVSRFHPTLVANQIVSNTHHAITGVPVVAYAVYHNLRHALTRGTLAWLFAILSPITEFALC